MIKFQRGGFLLGMIVGLLIGLALALAVAMYITKVPLPFVDKVPQRTAEQDAAEVEHNKNWDPNSALYGGNPAKPKPVPSAPATEPGAAEAGAVAPAPTAPPVVVPTPPAAAPPAPTPTLKPGSSSAGAGSPSTSARNPAAILSSGGEASGTPGGADTATYFVQAGAYGSEAEAEQQRAKLTMMGMEPQITQREVNGRTMHRVRLGPFAQKEQAEEVRTKLAAARVDAALIRAAK